MRRRLGSIFGWIAAVWLLVGVPAAYANGFPSFDAARETIVAGRVNAKSTAKLAAATTLGTWKLDDSKLVVDETEGKKNRFWLAKAPKLRDGMVRVRVELGKNPDGAVLFRTSAEGSDLREMSGYELTWSKTGVRFHRWDRGFVLPTVDELKIKKFTKFKSLEIVVLLVGPQVMATVYDGEALTPITTLAVHETTYADGLVGVRAGAKDEGTKIQLLTVMDTRKPAPATKGSGKHGALKLYGIDRDPGTTAFGNTRFVFMRKDEADKLPKDLRKDVQSTFKDDDGVTKSVVFTNTTGMERIGRLGLDVIGSDANVPWKVFDSQYREAASKPPKKTRRGFDLDESYKNPQMVEELVKAYHAKYPGISKLIEVGRTHQGRTIWGLKISDNPETAENEPSIMFNGGHHASELLAVEYPLDAMAELLERYGRDAKVTRWVNGLEIFIVPLVNPDGNHMFLEESRFAYRKNARDSNLDGWSDPFEGVDLSRNYPFGWGKVGSSGVRTSPNYRGAHGGSEPETRAMMALARQQHFAASISFHTIGTVIFPPYNADGVKEPEPHAALIVATEMAEEAGDQASRRPFAVRETGYPVAGSDQDWLLHEFGTLAYVLEGSHHNPPMTVRTNSVKLTRGAWEYLLERVLNGARVSGTVVDTAGKPVVAEVRLKEVQTSAGEHWKTRESDGRFDRVLAAPGKYTIEVRAKGFTTATKTVRVRNNPVDVDITLTPA